MRVRRSWAALLLFLGQALALAAEPGTPREWLQAMGEAMQRLNYRATVAYGRDNRIQTLRLWHVVEDGTIHERLQALDGPRRTVVRDADEVQCYFPERRVLIVERRRTSRSLFDKALPSRWDELTRHYRFALGARSHVAGRPARELVIEPRDGERYGRRLWLDEETRLPLRFELVDGAGNVLESFVVTALETGDTVRLPAAPGSGNASGWKVIDHREADGDARWRLRYLPPGFREVRRDRRIDPVDGARVDHLLLSDGLATVSVYIRPADGAPFDVGQRRLGAVNVYTRRVGDHWVTVLGDVPPVTVRRIAEGVTDGAS